MKSKVEKPSTYFMMNLKDHRVSLKDFGLKESNESDVYISTSDGSRWICRHMKYSLTLEYEKVFCKIPVPNQEQLISIVMHAESLEDQLGAASLLLELYPEEVYQKSVEMLKDESFFSAKWKFFDLLGLENPINRSGTNQKSLVEVQSDYERWVSLAHRVATLKKQYKLKKFY